MYFPMLLHTEEEIEELVFSSPEYILGMKILIGVFVFLFGIVIGSFLNVLIYRMPLGLDFKKGSSFCPDCKHELKWYDLFPLFSWIFLGGKCRYCKAKISPIYPLVEALNGILWVLAYVFYTDCELNFALLGVLMVTSALIVVYFIDMKHQIIPDSMWVTVLLGGVLVYVQDILDNGFDWRKLVARIVGFFLVSTLLYILGLIYKGGMGGGDIKLMAAAGFLLGWRNVLVALMFGSLLGVLCMAFQKSLKKSDMKKAVPFGPHLSVGILLALYFATPLLNWYVGLWA